MNFAKLNQVCLFSKFQIKMRAALRAERQAAADIWLCLRKDEAGSSFDSQGKYFMKKKKRGRERVVESCCVGGERGNSALFLALCINIKHTDRKQHNRVWTNSIIISIISTVHSHKQTHSCAHHKVKSTRVHQHDEDFPTNTPAEESYLSLFSPVNNFWPGKWRAGKRRLWKVT